MRTDDSEFHSETSIQVKLDYGLKLDRDRLVVFGCGSELPRLYGCDGVLLEARLKAAHDLYRVHSTLGVYGDSQQDLAFDLGLSPGLRILRVGRVQGVSWLYAIAKHQIRAGIEPCGLACRWRRTCAC